MVWRHLILHQGGLGRHSKHLSLVLDGYCNSAPTTVELPFDIREVTTFWENTSLTDPVALFILARSDGQGNVRLTESERDSPTGALKKFLKHSEVHLKARGQAANQTWPGPQAETWCVFVVCGDVFLKKYENNIMIEYLRTLFASVFIPHEISLRMPKIIEWAGNLFGRKLDGCFHVADISKPLAMSMSCLGKTAGIALITSRAICLLRPGSFAGRPFGMQPQKCCTLATFDSLSVIPRPFRITVLQWKCAKHGKSTQDFAPSLHGWVMVGRAGRSGHIAWWTIFLPPPTMQS